MKDELRFKDRHVEKNFIACQLPGFNAYSLGVRAAVLKLELFEKSKLEALGRIADPHTSGAEGMTHGLKSAGLDRAIHREVLGRVLSLVYFPFWMIPFGGTDGTRVSVIDGVSQALIGQGLDEALLGALRQTGTSAPAPTIGFRPLTCPNCGWDLPLRADDVVFACTSCRRAWSVQGNRLLAIRFAIAASATTEEPKRHLPLWAFRGKLPGETRGLRRERRLHVNDILVGRHPAWVSITSLTSISVSRSTRREIGPCSPK